VASGGDVRAAKLLFASTQISFGENDTDMKLAFERLDKAVAPQMASKAALMNVYGSSRASADKARGLAVPSTTAVFVEGLQATDATVAVEAVIPIP
jgi:hypothetical protein